MAKKTESKQSRTAGLIPFKPGESGNPNGRPRRGIAVVNEELKEAGFLPASKQDIEANYLSMIGADEATLKAMANDKDRPMLVRVLAKNILGGKGFDVIERMLDRGIGKPTQKTESEVVVKEIRTLSKEEEDFLAKVASGNKRKNEQPTA